MGAKLGGSGGGKYEEEANSSINVTPRRLSSSCTFAQSGSDLVGPS